MTNTNLLLINTIISPVIIAALASRLADIELMENTYKFSVPLTVDVEFGTDWYDAK